MFAKVLAFFALVAVAFASPKPDYLTYAAPGVAQVAPVAPLAYSGYSAYSPLAYSAPYAASAYPYPYSAYYVK